MSQDRAATTDSMVLTQAAAKAAALAEQVAGEAEALSASPNVATALGRVADCASTLASLVDREPPLPAKASYD